MATSPANNKRFWLILISSILTALFFTFILAAAAGLHFYSSHQSAFAEDAAKPAETPPRRKLENSVSASGITKITYSTWEHKGLLSSGDGYVSSVQIVFMSDGTAAKTTSTDYDASSRTDKTHVARAAITAEQFKRLAEAVAANDFFHEADSANIRSEAGVTLTVSYSGGEKSVKTSNTGEDTPEVEAILRAFADLENQINWSRQ